MIDVINTVILWAIVSVAALALVLAVFHAFVGNWYGVLQLTLIALLFSVMALLAYADIKDNGGSAEYGRIEYDGRRN